MKRAEWKQSNPFDQQTVILMALEGHISNVEDGITKAEKCIQKITPLVEQLKELTPFLKKGSW